MGLSLLSRWGFQGTKITGPPFRLTPQCPHNQPLHLFSQDVWLSLLVPTLEVKELRKRGPGPGICRILRQGAGDGGGGGGSSTPSLVFKNHKLLIIAYSWGWGSGEENPAVL